MRAARLVSILLLLQARGRLTAAELAAEHEVSIRTIYRDLIALGAAGVPVYGERGQGGGYQLIDGYRTNLTGLTTEEAGTLLLTGASGPLSELGLGSLLATTRLKLLAAAPPALRPLATRAEQRFHFDPGAWAHAAPRDRRWLPVVAGAVWRDHRLRIKYRRGGGRAVGRLLDPLGLVHKTGTWYLVAGYQSKTLVYRVDRINRADEIDAPGNRPEEFDLAAFWEKWERAYADSLPTFSIQVRLGPEADRYKHSLGAISPRDVSDAGIDPDGWVRQRLLFDDRPIALAALRALGPDVEILEPPELRGELAASAVRLIERCTDPAN